MTSKRPINVYEYPVLENALKVIEEAISRRKALIIIGNCWVDYQGRASSKLDPGERILMIKEDGSLSVHRSVGSEPVNWQPPGCFFKIDINKNTLYIQAVRRKPRESLRIFFNKIYLLSVLSLVDEGTFYIYASEEDMQRAILSQPTLVEDGMRLITYEKKVEPGFIDVYGIDREGRMVIMEIKRKTATREAVLQLAKYVESVKKTTSRELRGILIAPALSKGVQKLLATLGLEFKQLDPKKCSEILRKIEVKKLSEFLQTDQK